MRTSKPPNPTPMPTPMITALLAPRPDSTAVVGVVRAADMDAGAAVEAVSKFPIAGIVVTILATPRGKMLVELVQQL